MSWLYFALLSAVAWAVVALFEKDTTHGEHALPVSSATSIIWGLLALLLIPFINLQMLPVSTIILIILSGFLFAYSYYLSAKAFKYLRVSVASPLYNLGTVITVLLAVIILNERFNLIQGLGIVLIIIGTYYLELKRGDFLQPFRDMFHSEKIHFAIQSVLGYSFLSICAKYLLATVDPITFLFTQLIISSVFIQLFIIFSKEGYKKVREGFNAHGLGIFLCAVFIVLAQLFDIEALKNGEASLAAPVIRVWTLLAVILGGRFYKEGHLKNRIIATIVMLVGVLVISLQ